MPGLVPGIHVFAAAAKTWMAGTSPAMTTFGHCCNAPKCVAAGFPDISLLPAGIP
jgi:hypothetical protein